MKDYYFGLSKRALETMREQAPYLHLIRASWDPARKKRGSSTKWGSAPHLALAKLTVSDCEALIWEQLSSSPDTPYTFNGLSMAIFELTADIAYLSPLDNALFELVRKGHIAMTYEAPILFLRTCDLVGVENALEYKPRPKPTQLGLW